MVHVSPQKVCGVGAGPPGSDAYELAQEVLLWAPYNNNTTTAVQYVAAISVKWESCFVVQAFVPFGYSCLLLLDCY